MTASLACAPPDWRSRPEPTPSCTAAVGMSLVSPKNAVQLPQFCCAHSRRTGSGSVAQAFGASRTDRRSDCEQNDSSAEPRLMRHMADIVACPNPDGDVREKVTP